MRAGMILDILEGPIGKEIKKKKLPDGGGDQISPNFKITQKTPILKKQIVLGYRDELF